MGKPDINDLDYIEGLTKRFKRTLDALAQMGPTEDEKYFANALRVTRNAALEEAAKVADKIRLRRYKNQRQSGAAIAQAIRELKDGDS